MVRAVRRRGSESGVAYQRLKLKGFEIVSFAKEIRLKTCENLSAKLK